MAYDRGQSGQRGRQTIKTLLEYFGLFDISCHTGARSYSLRRFYYFHG
jgi:hypothetical protein